MNDLEIRVWNVGHGLSVWIRTPNGQNHWVDAGYNPDGDFSPARHVAKKYNDAKPINLLTISHPDKDHIDDLDRMVKYLDRPLVLLRNKTLPDQIKFGSRQFDYQRAFEQLDSTYTQSVDWEKSPINPMNNGGIEIIHDHLDWNDAGDINNSSVVVMYLYKDTLVVFPGDIEPKGWNLLYPRMSAKVSSLVEKARFRILVAPHHGRGSGYCPEMFETLQPHLSIISDDYGRAPTDRRFRENGLGIKRDGTEKKFISTKANKRAIIIVGESGLEKIDSN